MGALSCCMRPSTATEPGNDDVLPGSSSTLWIRNMALDMEYWPLPGTPAFVQMGRGAAEDAAIRSEVTQVFQSMYYVKRCCTYF